ncbi:uncharacterized protein C8R40DRAFT_1128645 [Lentinula edodes]|uniref:uncharacterized protein n=1 Tax=Lentinula edodes TaxID=5353 RepID=UPI001E8E7FAC|nr:uncharacterized protein C8R40DRAFT_1128645 [Lentinula edodes]KAH7869874.1 hypothetical protein C8R40DRAFT_1128645 [Lentinula edodes]
MQMRFVVHFGMETNSQVTLLKHQRDDESETGAYAHMKSFITVCLLFSRCCVFPLTLSIKIVPDDSYPSSPMVYSPSTTQTDFPPSLTTTMISSPLSGKKDPLTSSNNRAMRWERVQEFVSTPSHPRSDGNRFQLHPTWGSIGHGIYQSRPSREVDPQSSFVDFHEQQRVLRFERRPESRGWRRNLKQQIFNAFQILRRLWRSN